MFVCLFVCLFVFLVEDSALKEPTFTASDSLNPLIHCNNLDTINAVDKTITGVRHVLERIKQQPPSDSVLFMMDGCLRMSSSALKFVEGSESRLEKMKGMDDG